jgi:Pro-kumamolisin, activation domain
MTPIVSRALLSGAIMLGFAVQFSSPSGAQSVALIRQAVDNTQRIMLPGHTRPEANAANDVGPVADNFAMPHMLLQLKRSSAQQQQLEQLAADVSNPSSPSYRQFLTAAQFAAAYGPIPRMYRALAAGCSRRASRSTRSIHPQTPSTSPVRRD